MSKYTIASLVDGSALYTGNGGSLRDVVEKAVQEGVSLQNADFRGVELVGANLAGADLRGANFNRADLYKVNFVGADTTGARFEDACLHSTRGL